MRTPWQKTGLSTDPPSTEMGPLARSSLGITAPAPANVVSATAVLRNLADNATVNIDAGSVASNSSGATVLVDGPVLGMARGNTYRLEVLFVRSNGLKDQSDTVIGCPA